MQFIYAFIMLTFSNESTTTTSSQYENPVFDPSKTDVHTYQGMNTSIIHTYLDRNNDAQSNDDITDHTYQEPDQEAKYIEIY